jgi:hypothetical protein
MRPLPEREDAWAAHQDEATLTAYIARALQILRNVGLEPNGVTSPWALGREVEEAYANAIAAALREACGVRLGWYFLHLDSHAPAVPPRVMRLDPQAGTALVSIISGSREISSGHYDFAWRTQFGEPAEIDVLLTADGTSGRLVELFAHDSPLAFHTHWQSLFSNGSGDGLDAFGRLVERINNTWGDRIRWTSARELATYCTAREATRVEAGDGGRRVTFRAPFSCFEFTIAVAIPDGATTLYLDNTPLERLPDGDAPLHEGTWRRAGADALICVPLHDGTALMWR